MRTNLNNSFLDLYEELSKLNEDSSDIQKKKARVNTQQKIRRVDARAEEAKAQIEGGKLTFNKVARAAYDVATLKPIRDQIKQDSDLRQKAKAGDEEAKSELNKRKDQRTTNFKNNLKQDSETADIAFVATTAAIGTIVAAVNPVSALILGTTLGAGLVSKLIADTIEKSRLKKVTNGKANVKAVLKQDPTLKQEVQQLIDKFGKEEAEQMLANLEKHLEEHPEALEISKDELDARRNGLTQLIQKAGAKKAKQYQEQFKRLQQASGVETLNEDAYKMTRRDYE